MPYKVRNVVLAVALAALAAILTIFYVANYKRSVQEDEKNVPVVVAISDVPAGTTGTDAFAKGLVEVRELPRRTIVPGAVASATDIGGKVAAEAVYAGEQVTARRFVSNEEAGVRSLLKGNLRAIQVAADANQLLGGTLKKGDRVDIVGTWNVPENAVHHVSRVILRDLLVLRISGSFGETGSASPVANGSVQLLVTDSQASKLEWIVENGKWRLQLRPPADAEDSPENIENFNSLMLDGIGPEKIQRQLGAVAEGSEG